MTKTLKNVRQNDKELLKKMHFVADCIPLQQFSEDGIFLVQSGKKHNNKYSVTYQLKDISYLSLSEEMKKQIFLAWSAVLNILDPGSTCKLSVIKHKIGTSTLERFQMHNQNPDYTTLQNDYNKIITQKALQGNGMIQEVYLTISVNKKDLEAARSFFLRTTSALQTQLLKLGSMCHQLTGVERLELLHDIYRSDKENEPVFNLNQSIKTGSSAKNYIAPESFEFETDYFKMGSLYGRALVLHSYPTYLKDSVVSDLCDINRRLLWSMDIIPVPMDEAVDEAEKRATTVESNIAKWYQKQYANKNYAMEPTYDLKQQREQAQEYLIDRCTDLVLRDYVRGGCVGEAPTLIDFHKCMLEQPEEEAHDIALAIELYSTGSLSTFAKKTNIDVSKRIICFDIHELGESLMSIGMLVLFDHIQNRMIKNRMKGITTSILNDEFYLMFQHEYTSAFFYKMWKRGRKYGADYCGITQNVEDLLRSPNGRAIVSTSELIIMLNQAPLDREQLADLLDISENQQEYITNAKPGSGLIKIGADLIPFENDIPTNSSIYKLLTTKPGEAIYDQG